MRAEAENERALQIVNRLMDKGEDNLSPEETSLFRLLVRLIEDFEKKTYPTGSFSSPRSVLQSIMEDHELKQKDLLGVFGSSGTISEVLSGKRQISKTQAKLLGEKFSISAELFIWVYLTRRRTYRKSIAVETFIRFDGEISVIVEFIWQETLVKYKFRW